MKIFYCVFWVCLCLPMMSVAQEKFDYYLSNSGNDAYPGTSTTLPKQTIAGVAPLLKNISAAEKIVKVGLRSGDIWQENLVTSYPIHLNTYADKSGENGFAILDGTKEFNAGWSKEAGSNNTFRQPIPYTGFVGYGINVIGLYSFIYVFEIDKALEKTAPFTARKILQFVSSPTAVENTPGSFFTPTGNPNPMPVYIHTSDGSSPNTNARYRYEVCVRDWAVNSTYEQNNRFENLWVRGFGAGNGMLPGGANSYYNKVIFGPGASAHHLVLRSGTIDHSLFLPAPKNTNGYAVVFYDDEGLQRHCTVKNSIFLDVRLPVYAHTTLGSNYGAVEMNNVVAFADSTDVHSFMYTSNTDSVLLTKVYADGYPAGYNYGTAQYAGISNSVFKDVTFGIAYSPKNPVRAFVSNTFIKTKGTGNLTGIFIQENTVLSLTNSIFHMVSAGKNNGSAGAGTFVYGGGGAGKVSAKGNIFICDVDPLKTAAIAATNISKGTGTSTDNWSNNVYILLKGKNITWVGNNDVQLSSIESFEDWKKQSGQDQNSLFFDLRYDRRGLKAIFVDPANGNYELANTLEGKQIAALKAGMTTPLTCFLARPTYEEAADMIRYNRDFSVNACRTPCERNTIRINNTFNLSAPGGSQVKCEWNISEQQKVDHYELERASDLFGFKKISINNVSADSGYSFLDNVQPGVTYRYRLVVVAKAGGQCYSDTRTIHLDDSRSFLIYPNPSRGKITVSLNGYLGSTTFSVLNAMGQTIKVVEGLSAYRSIELNFTDQPKGVYFLKLKTSNGPAIQKFILQ